MPDEGSGSHGTGHCRARDWGNDGSSDPPRLRGPGLPVPTRRTRSRLGRHPRTVELDPPGVQRQRLALRGTRRHRLEDARPADRLIRERRAPSLSPSYPRQLKNNRRTTEERCSSQAAGPSVPRRAGRSVSGSVSPRAGGGRPPPSPTGRRSPRTAARTPASAGSRPSPPRATPGPPPGSPPRTHRSRARP
jgi:hypothetical protein